MLSVSLLRLLICLVKVDSEEYAASAYEWIGDGFYDEGVGVGGYVCEC